MDTPSPYKSKGLFESFGNATRGVWQATKREKNIRWHALIFFLVLVLALRLGFEPIEISIIFAVAGLVFAVELLNTALEYIEDIVQPQYHEAVRHSKDIAAAAVLIASIMAALAGIFLFVPHFL